MSMTFLLFFLSTLYITEENRDIDTSPVLILHMTNIYGQAFYEE